MVQSQMSPPELALHATTNHQIHSDGEPEHTDGRKSPVPIRAQATRARGHSASIACSWSIGIVAAKIFEPADSKTYNAAISGLPPSVACGNTRENSKPRRLWQVALR